MAIKVKNLKYTYPDGTLALNNISTHISKGKKTAILGANGSGKSTLLKHFNGLILPQNGSVSILNQDINKSNLDEIRKKLGFVFDNPDNQLFATTVYEDIAFGPRNLAYNESQVKELVGEIVELLKISDLINKQPHNLSLGQKRKVAIAGVLSMKPEILVFDEPFSGLDPVSLGEFIQILNNLYKSGHSIIVTTHDVDIAYEWADEIIILNQGELLDSGDISIMENENLLKKANLKLPVLYEIFSLTNTRIRNKNEAKDYIGKLYKNL